MLRGEEDNGGGHGLVGCRTAVAFRRDLFDQADLARTRPCVRSVVHHREDPARPQESPLAAGSAMGVRVARTGAPRLLAVRRCTMDGVPCPACLVMCAA